VTITGEFQRIRSYLIDASDNRRIRNSINDIYKLLRMDGRADGYGLIACGGIDFHRDGGVPHLTRDDGARLTFSLTLVEAEGVAALVAYRVELAGIPSGAPPFLRFDFDSPGKPHEANGLRSHLHPGSDLVRVPAPVMTPLEILDLLLYGSCV
jgi:hypothetical protein